MSSAGLALGRAVADELDRRVECRAIVAMQHGLITWGASPKQAYDDTIEIVRRAEEYIGKKRRRVFSVHRAVDREIAQARYVKIAPLLRGLLSPPSDNPDSPFNNMILVPLISAEILELLDSPRADEIACTAPLTPDYLVRTKSYPLFVGKPDYDDLSNLRRQLAGEIGAFSSRYEAYVKRHASRLPECTVSGLDPLPRVVLLPGLGAVCAGPDIAMARIARDITEQALVVKRTIRETGGAYLGLAEEHLFDMEFRAFQRAKVAAHDPPSLRGHVAIVTGAAGAIGSGICEELLKRGCHVAATDLAGDRLDFLALSLKALYGDRVSGLPLDVTDGASVAAAFEKTIETFGGIDIVVINAGLAHVSPLAGMNIDAFRALERVNVEGTLLLLSQAAKLFALQNTGGDVVLDLDQERVCAGRELRRLQRDEGRIPSVVPHCQYRVRGNGGARKHGRARCRVFARGNKVGPVGAGRAGPHEGPRTRRKRAGRVLPPAKPAEGAGHGGACRTGRRFFRDPSDADDRRDDSRRRRIAGCSAPVKTREAMTHRPAGTKSADRRPGFC